MRPWLDADLPIGRCQHPLLALDFVTEAALQYSHPLCLGGVEVHRRFLVFDLGKARVVVLEHYFEGMVTAFCCWEETRGDCTLKALALELGSV